MITRARSVEEVARVINPCFSSVGPGGKMIATNEAPNGVRFEGTGGWIFVDRGQIKASKQELVDTPLPSDAARLYKSDNHLAADIGAFLEFINDPMPSLPIAGPFLASLEVVFPLLDKN